MARGKRGKNAAPHCADTRAVHGVRGFGGLPKCVLESEAYRQLSMMARAILNELVGRMNGYNNGRIHASYAELAYRLNRKNEAAIGHAIAELIQHGLIDLSAESVWRERKAREYRLTFVNTTDTIGRTIPATNDYLCWQSKNDATDVVAAKVKSATAYVAGEITVATTYEAANNGKLRKPLKRTATTGVVPIIKPYVGRDGSEGEPLKNPERKPAGEWRHAGSMRAKEDRCDHETFLARSQSLSRLPPARRT